MKVEEKVRQVNKNDLAQPREFSPMFKSPLAVRLCF